MPRDEATAWHSDDTCVQGFPLLLLEVFNDTELMVAVVRGVTTGSYDNG